MLAKELIEEAVARNGTRPEVMQADRGSAMTPKPVAEDVTLRMDGTEGQVRLPKANRPAGGRPCRAKRA